VESGAINFNAVFALPAAAEFTGNPDLYKDVNDHELSYIFNTPGENEQETTFVSLKVDYEFDGATLTGILAYDDMEEYLLSDGTSAAFGGYSFGAPASQAACTETYNSFDTSLLSSPFYAIQDGKPPGTEFVPEYGGLNGLLPAYSPTTCDGYQYQERNQESTSLEVKLASDDDGSMRWLAGFYYAKIEREVVVAYGADLGLGFDTSPYIPPEGRNPTDLLFWDDFDTTVYSGFGQIEIDLAERHEVALAIRYDEEEREVSNKVPNVLNAQIFGAFGQGPINPAFDGSGTDSIPDRDETFDEWQPKVSYTFSMNDDVSFYGTYGRGFRSGGFNSLGSSATVNGAFGSFATAPVEVNDDYDKEVTDSFEVGFKSKMMDNRLRINAAAFYTEIDDYQFFNFFAGSFGLLRVVTNIDEVELQGAEIDFAFALNEYFTFSGGYGIVDSEIKENENRPYTEGNDLPIAPESSGAFSIDFGAPLGSIQTMIRADLQYVGKTWFHSVQEETTINAFTDLSEIYQTPGFGFGPSDYANTQRDSYYTVNLRGGISGENWSIVAWSRNVTDEDYLEEIIPAPEFGGSFIHDSAGRVSGVDFTYSF
jgi:iron complex outermembrane receptor protein